MRPFRERYFEDHIAIPDDRRPGKVKYVYTGQYVEPFVESGSLKVWKVRMAAAELISVLIFLMAASRDVLFNYYRISAGIGTLAVVPWMLEIWAVFRVVISGDCIKETDRQSVENYMRAGTALHGLLMFFMAAAGSVFVIRAGEAGDSAFAILGHLCTGILSLIILKMYKQIYYYTLPGKGWEKGGSDWKK